MRINRAVAVAEVDGPEVALALLDGLDEVVGRQPRTSPSSAASCLPAWGATTRRSRRWTRRSAWRPTTPSAPICERRRETIDGTRRVLTHRVFITRSSGVLSVVVTPPDESPFPYHGPLDPDQVSEREDLVRDLEARITSRRPTALLGPRRYGKTSVLRRVSADLAEAGTETVWIDLYELNSVADLAGAIDQGLDQRAGPDSPGDRLARRHVLAADRVRRHRVVEGPQRSTRPGAHCSDAARRARAHRPEASAGRRLRRVLRNRPRARRRRDAAHAAPASLPRARDRVRRLAAVDDADAVHRPCPAVLRPGRPRGDRPAGRSPRSPTSSRTDSPRPTAARGEWSALSCGPPRGIRNERCSSPTPSGDSRPKAARPTRPRGLPRSTTCA